MMLWDSLRSQEGLARAHGFVPLYRPDPAGRVRKLAWVAGRAFMEGGVALTHLTRPGTLWPDFSAVPMLDEAGDFDAFVDISGFAYGDAWGPGPAYSIAPVLRSAWERSRPVVFMPQAWGGFDHRDVRDAAVGLLQGPRTLVLSRDPRSTANLEAAGIPAGAVGTRSDIVFAYEGGSAARGAELLEALGCEAGRPVVAVAPNMRVYERSPGAGRDNAYVRTLVALVRRCADVHGADVVLVPSECAPLDRGTDDRRLCAIVRDAADRHARCHTSADYLTAADARSIIGRCEYLVGSRFHALVFALSQGVPCTVLGWSHKYEALMSQFGVARDCVDHDALSESEAVELFESGWGLRHVHRSVNLAVADALRTDALALFDQVADFLTKAEPA
jgi:colanic acid/amylovoran biosynthesis protein